MKTLTLVLVLLTINSVLAVPEKFIVKVGHYTLPSLSTSVVKCFGTVISSRHVLTTASCVALPIEPNPRIGISVRQEEEIAACQ